MGAHLDAAAEQTSFIRHDGLDANSVAISSTVCALLVTKCEGKALSLVSLSPRHFWIGSVASAQGRVRGHRWKSHSSALERYSQPTCQMGIEGVAVNWIFFDI